MFNQHDDHIWQSGQRNPWWRFWHREEHHMPWWHWLWIGPLIFVAAVLLLALPFVWAAVDGVQHAMAGRSALSVAESSVSRMDIALAVTKIDEAIYEFSEAREQMNRFGLFSFVPGIGDRLAAADEAAATGIGAAEGIRDILTVGRDVSSVLAEANGTGLTASQIADGGIAQALGDLSPENRGKILGVLADNAGKLKDSAERLTAAIARIDSLAQRTEAAQYATKIASAREKLVAMRDSVTLVLPIVEVMPKVFGYRQDRNYLVILQNNTELRPTGGFLSLVGLLSVRDGDLAKEFHLADVYEYDVAVMDQKDREPAPAPFQKYVGVQGWYLRDANWSPDFPTSMHVISKFFREEYAAKNGEAAPAIDGIIAITPRPAADLLRIIGPIKVGDKEFDADNLVDELEFQVEQGFAEEGIPHEARKDIVGDLAHAVIAKVRGFDMQQALTLWGLMQQNLKTGDILLWSADAQLQDMILTRDWGGRLQPYDCDYVAVVDANLAALKTDHYVDRSVRYSVTPDGQGGYVGSVAVTYRNNGSFTWRSTRYRTYSRVYVPAGSELIEVKGSLENDKTKNPGLKPGKADVGDENGRRWFGAFTAIEPGRQGTMEFRFKLAPRIAERVRGGKYGLIFEKQPGVPAAGLTLELDFGKKLAGAEPAEARTDWGDAKYHLVTDLKQDRKINVKF